MRNEYYDNPKKFIANMVKVCTILIGTNNVLAKFGDYIVTLAVITPTQIISIWDSAVVVVTSQEGVTPELRQALNSAFEAMVEVYWYRQREEIIKQFRETRYGR